MTPTPDKNRPLLSLSGGTGGSVMSQEMDPPKETDQPSSGGSGGIARFTQISLQFKFPVRLYEISHKNTMPTIY